MTPVVVRAQIDFPVAVSRESARKLKPAIIEAFREALSGRIDFTGVQVVTPSFVDELCRLIEDCAGDSPWVADLTNMPAEPSSKFMAIARSHHLVLEAAAGTWALKSRGIAGVR